MISPGDESGWDVEVLIVRGESPCQHLIASSVGRRGDSVPKFGDKWDAPQHSG